MICISVLKFSTSVFGVNRQRDLSYTSNNSGILAASPVCLLFAPCVALPSSHLSDSRCPPQCFAHYGGRDSGMIWWECSFSLPIMLV